MNWGGVINEVVNSTFAGAWKSKRFVLDTEEILARHADSGALVVPLAGAQSKAYLEATLSSRWNPRGQQPLGADGARAKQAENIYGAIQFGTGAASRTFCIDWQDSDAPIAWLEMMLAEHHRGQILLWLAGAAHHTSAEVEEWLEAHPRLTVLCFPAYTPEENPQEATWKALKEEVSQHCGHETMADLRTAINAYYQSTKQHTVNFLAKFGYRWSAGRLYALSG